MIKIELPARKNEASGIPSMADLAFFDETVKILEDAAHRLSVSNRPWQTLEKKL